MTVIHALTSTILCYVGVWSEHGDISHAIDMTLTWDLHTNTPSATPLDLKKDTHGTRCAGQIASKPDNGVCGVGVAWNASIVPLRMLSTKIDAALESKAITMHLQDIDIYNCSWGPADDGKALDGPSEQVMRAFLRGIVEGREGRGAVYVFAAGNGKRNGDNCNADGYANAPFAFTIGAIDQDNNSPPYSEECAPMLGVTYSSSATHKMHTTEVGGGCTDKHGGTSAAAAIASGIYALVLQARPELTWRDLQHLTVQTARRINPEDGSWTRNGSGRWFSNKFGFGSLDAGRMVEMAREWKLVEKAVVISTRNKSVGRVFEHSLQSSFRVKHVNGIKALEKVAVTVSVRTRRRGNISIWLRSPAGTINTLMTHRASDDDDGGWKGWTFSTNAFFGEERVSGEWVLGVQNHGSTEGELLSWRLTFFGSAIDDGRAWNGEGWARGALYSVYPPSRTYFEDSQEELKGRAWIEEEHYGSRSMDDEWARLSGYLSSDEETRQRHWHRMDGRPNFLPRDQSRALLKGERKHGTDWLLWIHVVVLVWLMGGKCMSEMVIMRWHKGNSMKHQSLPL